MSVCLPVLWTFTKHITKIWIHKQICSMQTSQNAEHPRASIHHQQQKSMLLQIMQSNQSHLRFPTRQDHNKKIFFRNFTSSLTNPMTIPLSHRNFKSHARAKKKRKARKAPSPQTLLLTNAHDRGSNRRIHTILLTS